jgi:hypothetical protein
MIMTPMPQGAQRVFMDGGHFHSSGRLSAPALRGKDMFGRV